MSSKQNSVSSAGIVIDATTGERHVPSSTRADGSKRREIRIRPGYLPPEDVEVYKNRTAEAWKNRGSGGVPGAEGLERGGTSVRGGASASDKNAKRREARRRAKEAAADSQAGAINAASLDTFESDTPRILPLDDKTATGLPKLSAKQQTLIPVDPEVEKEKKGRNLKKKLRQARELHDRKDKGESLLPEQLEKAMKIQELIRQLDALGLDLDEGSKIPTDVDGGPK
jgi:partner of Y14 and mago